MLTLERFSSFAFANFVGPGFSLTKIFTIIKITGLSSETDVTAVSGFDLDTLRFGNPMFTVKPSARGEWLLFVRHELLPPQVVDFNVLANNFTLIDFTVTVTIDLPAPTPIPVIVSDTPVNVIPC